MDYKISLYSILAFLSFFILRFSSVCSSQAALHRVRDPELSVRAANTTLKRSKRRPINATEKFDSTSQLVDVLLQYYNKHEPPVPTSGTKVMLGVYIISFHSISEQTMDYAVSMYLRQKWRDPRLMYPPYKGDENREIRMGETKWESIWIPDTFLRNEKAATFHQVTVENRMLKLSHKGDLWYVTKISATLSCPMMLQSFPMDIQNCPMLFESFGYTTDTMYFDPMSKETVGTVAIAVEEGLQMPQFKIIDKQVEDCSQNYTTGVYPCLKFTFVLKRDIGYFLIQVYVPSILIVILSWVSFWINVDASPARVSIGLLTVLTTTTMSSGARATLPRVSYIKAIDVWMIICLLFVFLSLIEYAVVNVLARRPGRQPKQPRRAGLGGSNPGSGGVIGGSGGMGGMRGGMMGGTMLRRDTDVDAPLQPLERRKTAKTVGCFKGDSDDGYTYAGSMMRPTGGLPAPPSLPGPPAGPPAVKPPDKDGKYQARQVDKFSRKIFPFSFVFFNIVYWTYYSIATDPIGIKPEST